MFFHPSIHPPIPSLTRIFWAHRMTARLGFSFANIIQGIIQAASRTELQNPCSLDAHVVPPAVFWISQGLSGSATVPPFPGANLLRDRGRWWTGNFENKKLENKAYKNIFPILTFFPSKQVCEKTVI